MVTPTIRDNNVNVRISIPDESIDLYYMLSETYPNDSHQEIVERLKEVINDITKHVVNKLTGGTYGFIATPGEEMELLSQAFPEMFGSTVMSIEVKLISALARRDEKAVVHSVYRTTPNEHSVEVCLGTYVMN